MLKLLRHKHVAKIIFWALVILIMPAFVLWGTGSLSRGKEKGPKFVGTINDKRVDFDEFGENLLGIRSQIIINYAATPKILNGLLRNKEFIGKLAWDRAIMLREAKRYKINAADQEVVSFIRTHPLFISGGGFDPRIYEYVLKNNIGIYPRNFEEIVRENIEIQKLNDFLTKDISVTEDEILTNYKKDRERFKLSYIMIPSGDFLEKAKAGDAEIRDYYEKHKDELILPLKEGRADSDAPLTANFEEVREDIGKLLSEINARGLAVKQAEDEHKKIKELMEKERLSFEKSCEKLGLKTKELPFFLKTDYLDGIGEAYPLSEEAAKLKKDGLSSPVETRKGAILFTILDTKTFDEEEFRKEKDDYAKALLITKKARFLENWLRGLEAGSKLNIDLKDYEKYYR